LYFDLENGISLFDCRLKLVYKNGTGHGKVRQVAVGQQQSHQRGVLNEENLSAFFSRKKCALET
jgi:hypothetical protein